MEAVQEYETNVPEFRAIGHTNKDFFMISAGTPALLYKTGDKGKLDLVYREEGEGVFYDAMNFWNNQEGIVIGDSSEACFSILITRDGGNNWKKLSCDVLPEPILREGAFAASNTNIKIIGDKTWVATTKRILYSPDKGNTWEAFETPILDKSDTEGIYAIDFYDELLGVAVGGDYTNPELNFGNKAITIDGGKTWKLIAEGEEPPYKSCVQFVPGREGNEIVAVGISGISYSKDKGVTWSQLSNEAYHTIRFLNDSTAYAGGKNRISKLRFK